MCVPPRPKAGSVEAALATALHAALRHPDDPVAALGRAGATNGDSDSIACLTGAFHGSHTASGPGRRLGHACRCRSRVSMPKL
jgi:hypothetical protein